MSFNLAVFDINAADEIFELYPNINSWYIGGHSLGGSMAAIYASKNIYSLDGLILLASYSTANLSESDLDVISIYASKDNVLNMEKYQKYKANLPEQTEEIIIEGGNHSSFGSYGEQKGDGIAIIFKEEQIKQTAYAIENFLLE